MLPFKKKNYSNQQNNLTNHDLNLSNNNFPYLNSGNAINLTGIPSEIEIKNAVYNSNPLKTPGEYGLHVIFYQTNWNVVKNKLVTEIQEIFTQYYIPSLWGNTLLCLIPKVDNAHLATHLRPIGLCYTFYKILTEILVNRKKPFLPNLISPFQGAFTL